MPKNLSDILKGVNKSTTKPLTTGDNPGVDYADKMKDGRDFVAQHSVEKHEDRVGNGDDVYKGSTKKAKMERHGHEPKPKDIQVYNKTQQVASVKEEAEELEELKGYQGKKGQKLLHQVHNRASKRLSNAADKKDVETVRKNAGVMNKAWDRMNDVHEAKDEREYGYEGDMAITQLKTICRNAENLMKMLKPDTDLPEWVQSKITKAEDYISTANDYLASEMNEEALEEGGSQYRSAAGSGKNTNPNLSKLARKLAFEKPKSYRPPGTPSKAESKKFLDNEVEKYLKKGGKITKEEVEQLDEFKLTDEHKKAAIAKVRNRYLRGNPQFSFEKNEGGSHDLKVVAAGKEHFHRITHNKKTGLAVEKNPYMQSDEEYISEAKCNMTEAGKMCEVHGMKACSTEEKKPSDEQPMYNGKKKKGKQLILDKDIQEMSTSQNQAIAARIALKHKREGTMPPKGTASHSMMGMSEKQLKDYTEVEPGAPKKVEESISDQRSSKATASEKAREKIFAAMQRKKERMEKMKEESAAAETPITFPVTNSREGFRI